MTPQQLAALAELRARADDPPWFVENGQVIAKSPDGGSRLIAEVPYSENLPMIAMAPQLADEVAALTAELVHMAAERDDATVECGGYIGMLDRATDEIMRLRAGDLLQPEFKALVADDPPTKMIAGFVGWPYPEGSFVIMNPDVETLAFLQAKGFLK